MKGTLFCFCTFPWTNRHQQSSEKGWHRIASLKQGWHLSASWKILHECSSALRTKEDDSQKHKVITTEDAVGRWPKNKVQLVNGSLQDATPLKRKGIAGISMIWEFGNIAPSGPLRNKVWGSGTGQAFPYQISHSSRNRTFKEFKASKTVLAKRSKAVVTAGKFFWIPQSMSVDVCHWLCCSRNPLLQ